MNSTAVSSLRQVVILHERSCGEKWGVGNRTLSVVTCVLETGRLLRAGTLIGPLPPSSALIYYCPTRKLVPGT